MEALIGTIGGGVLAIFGGIIAKSFEEWRRRKSLRAAFRAEVSGIVEMIGTRGHQRRSGKPILTGSHAKPVDHCAPTAGLSIEDAGFRMVTLANSPRSPR